MNNRSYLIVMLALLTLLSSCGTIVNGSYQQVPLATSPKGAEVYVNGMLAGYTPTRIVLPRKQDHIITFSKEGYQDANIPLRSVMSGAFAGNLIAGGFVGMGVDAVSGGAYRLAPREVNVILRPLNEVDRAGYQTHVIPGQNLYR